MLQHLILLTKVKAINSQNQQAMPAALKSKFSRDQSIFVKAAIDGVVREGVMAAFLTALDDFTVCWKFAKYFYYYHFNSTVDSCFYYYSFWHWEKPLIL